MLAEEWLEYALRGEMHGFSNVSDTIAELYQGVNKSHPCGAALGLVGVGPSGDIAPWHRFVDSDTHSLGHVSTGIDKQKQHDFLDRGHINGKYDCHSCFARPLCAGGCHHEAYVRYGDTGHANLHYCDWIRDWTSTCPAHLRCHQRPKPRILTAVCRKEGPMRHMRPLNKKARRIDEYVVSLEKDVVALQNPTSAHTFPWGALYPSRQDGK